MTRLFVLISQISRCIYNHSVYQLTATLRGGLVSLIFRKSLQLDAAAASKTNAVTLMSTDIDSIASGVKELHEIWASVLELCVAIYLLYLQIGPACFVVIIPAVGKGAMRWELLRNKNSQLIYSFMQSAASLQRGQRTVSGLPGCNGMRVSRSACRRPRRCSLR